MAFDPQEYKYEFRRENYDQMSFLVPKGKRQVIRDYAATKGISVAQLIIRALEDCYKLDLGK